MGRAFHGHRTTAEAVGGVDLGPCEVERRQQLEGGIIQRARRDPRTSMGRRSSQRVLLMAASGGFWAFAATRADGKVEAKAAVLQVPPNRPDKRA
jgi:hypothetical protein